MTSILVDTIVCAGRFINIYQSTDSSGQPVSNKYHASVTIGRNENGTSKQKHCTGNSIDKVKYKVYSLFNINYEASFTNNLDLTLLQCLNDWLYVYHQHDKISSRAAMDYRINQVIGPHIQGIKLQAFTQQDAQKLIYILTEDYSGSVVCACASILRRCLDVHVTRRDIPYNPAIHLWLPKNGREKDIVPFTRKEIRKFAELCNQDELGPLFMVCFHCSMRIGEAIALSWSDIDWENKTITIRHTNSRGFYGQPEGIQDSTKGNQPRTIACGDQVFTYLHKAQPYQVLQKSRAGSSWIDSNLCFTDSNGKSHHYGKILHRFHKICEQLGRPEATPHYLRHTMASYLYDQEETIHNISEILGHNNEITTQVYISPTEITMERHREMNESISKSIVGDFPF